MAVDVKICGIMTPEHGCAAVAAGADLIGLVFAPSRRRVSVAQAQTIVEVLRSTAARLSATIGVVGVFVNEQPDTINQIAEVVGLDWDQFSGHEELRSAAAIDKPLVKAIRFDQHPSEAAWLAQPDTATAHGFPLLVDANVAGSFGGAGVTGDWQRAADLARRWPVWLAGGLTPENVAAAIRRVQPRVVDVSSGVETDGVKDVAKIEAFIQAVKQVNREGADASPARG